MKQQYYGLAQYVKFHMWLAFVIFIWFPLDSSALEWTFHKNKSFVFSQHQEELRLSKHWLNGTLFIENLAVRSLSISVLSIFLLPLSTSVSSLPADITVT